MIKDKIIAKLQECNDINELISTLISAAEGNGKAEEVFTPQIVGEIPSEIAEQVPQLIAAPIILDKAGFDHISKEHAMELGKMGMTATDFVKSIIDGFDSIYADKEYKDRFQLVCSDNKTARRVIIGIKRDGNTYRVITAMPTRSSRLKKEKLLWEGAANLHVASAAATPPLDVNSDKATSDGNVPDSESEVNTSEKNISEREITVDYVQNLEDTISQLKAQIEALKMEAQNGRASGTTTDDLRDDQTGTGRSESSGHGQGQDGQAAVSDVTDTGLRGKAVKLKVPKHPDLDTQYEVVELSSVKASHIPSEDFRVNRDYGLENERQYQTEKGSQDKVLRNAANLDPDYLVNQSIDANQGAPVVDYLGNVLGGNSRTMSIGIVYEKYPQKAEAYKQALIDHASDFGMSAGDIAKMKQPILIRRVPQEMSKEERQDLVSALNEDFKATRERKAEGKSRGMRVKKSTITAMARRMRESDASSLRDFFDKNDSLDVIQLFIQDGVISETESNSFIAADGKLNPEGKRVIEESLRGRLVEKYETLSHLKATTLERVDRALPDLLFLEAVGQGWSITKQVQKALSLTSQYTAGNFDGTGTFLNQINMLTGKTPKETVSKKTCLIFERLINDGKDKSFAKRVGKMAVDSNLSDGGLPGLAKTPPESFQAAFEPEEKDLK